MQVGSCLSVYLHDAYLTLLGYEKLREHAHTRAYLKYGEPGTSIHRVGNTSCNIEVCQEVLSEMFLGSYRFHTTFFMNAKII